MPARLTASKHTPLSSRQAGGWNLPSQGSQQGATDIALEQTGGLASSLGVWGRRGCSTAWISRRLNVASVDSTLAASYPRLQLHTRWHFPFFQIGSRSQGKPKFNLRRNIPHDICMWALHVRFKTLKANLAIRCLRKWWGEQYTWTSVIVSHCGFTLPLETSSLNNCLP